MRKREIADAETVIIKTREYFMEITDIHTVIIYGSTVKAVEGAVEFVSGESDIDIAVAGDDVSDPERRRMLYEELSEELGREVDIRDLSSLHGIILSQVLLGGIVVKRENLRYYESKLREMLYFREDMLPILLKGMENRLNEFVHGG